MIDVDEVEPAGQVLQLHLALAGFREIDLDQLHLLRPAKAFGAHELASVHELLVEALQEIEVPLLVLLRP